MAIEVFEDARSSRFERRGLNNFVQDTTFPKHVSSSIEEVAKEGSVLARSSWISQLRMRLELSLGVGDADERLKKDDGGPHVKDYDCNIFGWHVLSVKVEGDIKFSQLNQTTGKVCCHGSDLRDINSVTASVKYNYTRANVSDRI